MGIKKKLSLSVLLAVFAVVGGYGVTASAKDWGKYQSGEQLSGYTYATKETRAMQDDDFANPSYI